MEFKKFLILLETIDDKTLEAIVKSKWPPHITKDAIDQAIEQMKSSPEVFDKRKAFSFIQEKIGLKTKTIEVQEPQNETLKELHKKLLRREITIPEYKTAEYFLNNFKNETSFKENFEEAMQYLRKFIQENRISLIFKEKPIINFNNQNLDNYKDLLQFNSILHGIESQLEGNTFESDAGLQNPAFLELQHGSDLVAKGNNIWVFKGDDPVKCRIMGKGQKWCISSSTSVKYYFGYRHDHGQTQYFIFDFNKAPNDPARYVNPGVAPIGKYSEWVDRSNAPQLDINNRNVSFAINGYETLEEYLQYLESKGISRSVFTTEAVSEYEKQLKKFVDKKDFEGAKNYPDERKTKDGTPYMFYYFLKIVDSISDENFNTLTPNQKDEFLIGKEQLTNDQVQYVLNKNTKYLKEYLDSINDYSKFLSKVPKDKVDSIIEMIIQTNDYKKLLNSPIIGFATDKIGTFKKIIENGLIDFINKENTSAFLRSQFNDFLNSENFSHEERMQIGEMIIKNRKELFSDDVAEIIGSFANHKGFTGNLQAPIDNIRKIFELIIDKFKDKNKKLKNAEAWMFLDTLQSMKAIYKTKNQNADLFLGNSEKRLKNEIENYDKIEKNVIDLIRTKIKNKEFTNSLDAARSLYDLFVKMPEANTIEFISDPTIKSIMSNFYTGQIVDILQYNKFYTVKELEKFIEAMNAEDKIREMPREETHTFIYNFTKNSRALENINLLFKIFDIIGKEKLEKSSLSFVNFLEAIKKNSPANMKKQNVNAYINKLREMGIKDELQAMV